MGLKILLNSLIPVENYAFIFYNVILVLVFFSILRIINSKTEIFNFNKKDFHSFFLLLFLILYIGLRPISGIFGDMNRYNRTFEAYQMGESMRVNKDIVWNYFMKVCSNFISAKSFFFICAILYIFPLYSLSKKWLGKNKYILFLMLIASFSFWGYGTNGIRNGIATSFLLYAFSIRGNKKKKYFFIVLSAFFHLSVVIPVAAYLLSSFVKKTKYFFYGWILAIPLSLVSGGFWVSLFTSFGFDERVSYLLTDNIDGNELANVGFRWDFILYSASAVFAGYYFIIKKKFADKEYIQLFNIYLIANAFWILVIRANFSNRFAYLSWFMIAIIIFYPFFKQKFFVNQHKKLASFVFLYFCFTYFMTL